VRLDDAGIGANIQHRFGLGSSGDGSNLINLRHSTLTCSVIVYATGTPQITGTKALNIACTANTSTISILKGSVMIGAQDGVAPDWASISIGHTSSQSLDADVDASNSHTSSTVITINGGSVLLGSTSTATITVNGGTIRVENQSGTVTAISIFGGIVQWANGGTITAFVLQGGGLDLSYGTDEVVITDGQIHAGSTFRDPYRRRNIGNTVEVKCELDDATIELGASDANPVSISN
jgi:hypothetical protein